MPCCRSGSISICSAAIAPGSATGSCSTSSSRRWSSAAATSAWPTTPAQNAPCAAAVKSGSPPAWPTSSTGWLWPPTTASSAWSLTTSPWTAASPRHRAAARSPAQARSTAARAVQAVPAGGGPRHPAWRCTRGGQPPRRRPAGRHARYLGRGWSAARAANRTPGRRLRLPALLPGACSPWSGRPGCHAWGPCACPGGPQVGGGTLACLVERVRQAALVHRAATGVRGVLARAGLCGGDHPSPGPLRLDAIPLGPPPPPPTMTTRPLPEALSGRSSASALRCGGRRLLG